MQGDHLGSAAISAALRGDAMLATGVEVAFLPAMSGG